MIIELPKKYQHLAVPITIVIGIIVGLCVSFFSVKFSPMIGLAAAGGTLAGLIMVRYPDLALYVMVALVPIERFGRFTDDSTQFTISLMRMIGVFALGVLVLHRLLRRQPITFGPAFFLYGGFVVMAILSVIYTTDKISSIRGAAAIFGNLLFFFVLINMLKTRKHVFVSLIIWLSVSGLIGVYSAYDWHYGSGQDDIVIDTSEVDRGKGVQTQANRWATVWVDRAEMEKLGGTNIRRSMGPTSHAAVYGINCILLLPFLLYILKLPVHVKWKILSLVVLGLTLYSILLTNTRATILLAGLVGGMCLIRGLVKLRPGQYIALAVAGVSLVGYIPADVYNRIFDLSNYTMENSASLRIRVEYAQAGLEAISQHWLIGSGVANENIVPAYLNSWSTAPEKTTVHNEYLQTFMELGVIGWTFMASFLSLLLYYSIRAAKNFSRNPDTQQEYWFMVSIQIAMVSVLIYGAQVDVFHFPLKGWWLLAGMTVSMYTISNELIREQSVKQVEQEILEG